MFIGEVGPGVDDPLACKPHRLATPTPIEVRSKRVQLKRTVVQTAWQLRTQQPTDLKASQLEYPR